MTGKLNGISIESFVETDKNNIKFKFTGEKNDVFGISLNDDDTISLMMMLKMHLKDKGVDWCETSN